MKFERLCAMVCLGALGIVGCAGKSTDTYKGEAVESGSIKIAVTGSEAVAKNESPPRKLENETVVVTRDGGKYNVKFGKCELNGESGTATMAVVKGNCDVKIANWDGKLPLSATLSFADSGALKMEVVGTSKNDNAVATYEWTFNGKK